MAIRFNIGHASLCIVNSHFASGKSSALELDDDIVFVIFLFPFVMWILSSSLSLSPLLLLFFLGQENTEIRNKEYESTFNESVFLSGRRLSSHSCLIWMGDFNYRMSVANVDSIRPLLERKDYTRLLPLDSLSIEKQKGRTMGGLKEAALIDFPPTYKWIKHSDSLDLFQRVPGWTDRIFYSGSGLVCSEYQSIQHCHASDHRPVYACFSWNMQQQMEDSNRSSVTSSTSSPVSKVPGTLTTDSFIHSIMSCHSFLSYPFDRGNLDRFRVTLLH